MTTRTLVVVCDDVSRAAKYNDYQAELTQIVRFMNTTAKCVAIVVALLIVWARCAELSASDSSGKDKPTRLPNIVLILGR